MQRHLAAACSLAKGHWVMSACMQISTAHWPAPVYPLPEAAVVDDFTAVDWIDGMHHFVSHAICWPAGLSLLAAMLVMLMLQPSMQAALDILSGLFIACFDEGSVRDIPSPHCLPDHMTCDRRLSLLSCLMMLGFLRDSMDNLQD